MPPELFRWHVFQVGDFLPDGWIEELLAIAERKSQRRDFRPTMVTAREADPGPIPITAVDGDHLAAEAPWLADLYRGWFAEIGATLGDPTIYPSDNHKVALSLNIQTGTATRYPCHVDSNPLEGLLYLTDCDTDTGGELVVGLDPNTSNVDEVERHCELLYPRAGQLFFFDARRHAHYVRPLRREGAVRAVVTMNYYSASCPETQRPAGLDEQLFVRTKN
ncbi:2OG-Fe(II) oxygenase [Streptomyces alkaliphilus]|uniref:2OG-Fe(II) oxygenase n=1 Tax=Streptomyces alkaliphilus TaxID=1472722 RepID=UPI001563E49D|nr:2OG-Fe(II) oxygenase [Streptomyces alkaliphilus]